MDEAFHGFMKTKVLWGGIALSLGLATMLAGCATPCSPCSSGPTAVRECTVQAVEIKARTHCPCKQKGVRYGDPCIYAQTNTGLDGW